MTGLRFKHGERVRIVSRNIKFEKLFNHEGEVVGLYPDHPYPYAVRAGFLILPFRECDLDPIDRKDGDGC